MTELSTGALPILDAVYPRRRTLRHTDIHVEAGPQHDGDNSEEIQDSREEMQDSGDGTGNMARSSAIMAAGTMTSRVLGLVRTALLALALGNTGLITDIFSIANVLPNFIYLMVAGGLFNAVLVPQVIKAIHLPDRGSDFISRIMTLTVVVLAPLTLIVTLAAPLIFQTVTQLDANQLPLATIFAYWLFPQIFFYGLYAVMGQVLNAHGRFGAYMWAPALNNVVAIAGLLVFIAMFGTNKETGFTPGDWSSHATIVLAGSTTLGIVLQALILIWPLSKLRLGLRPLFGLRGVGLGTTAHVAKWTILTMLVGNGAYLVYTSVASKASSLRNDLLAQDPPQNIAGHFTLETASMLYIIPHSVIALSLATVLFNRMSHSFTKRDLDGVRESISTGLRTIGVATVFFSAVLVVLAGPISVFFSGGSDVDAAIQAQVLILLAVSAPFFSSTFVMNRAFYANEDGRTPFIMQVILSIVGVSMAVAAAFLPAQFIVMGLAVAYSLGNVAATIVSHIFLKKELGDYGAGHIIDVHLKLVAAALVSAAVGAGALWLFGGYRADGFAWQNYATAVVVVSVCGTLMGLVYLLLLKALRVSELKEFLAPLLRRVGRA